MMPALTIIAIGQNNLTEIIIYVYKFSIIFPIQTNEKYNSMNTNKMKNLNKIKKCIIWILNSNKILIVN